MRRYRFYGGRRREKWKGEGGRREEKEVAEGKAELKR